MPDRTHVSLAVRADTPDRVRVVYDAGARARAAGYTHLETPHKDAGSWEHEAWLRGWGGQPHPSITPKRRTL